MTFQITISIIAVLLLIWVIFERKGRKKAETNEMRALRELGETRTLVTNTRKHWQERLSQEIRKSSELLSAKDKQIDELSSEGEFTLDDVVLMLDVVQNVPRKTPDEDFVYVLKETGVDPEFPQFESVVLKKVYGRIDTEDPNPHAIIPMSSLKITEEDLWRVAWRMLDKSLDEIGREKLTHHEQPGVLTIQRMFEQKSKGQQLKKYEQ